MSQQGKSILTAAVKATGVIVANRFIANTGAQTGAAGNAFGVARSAAAVGDMVPVDLIGTSFVDCSRLMLAFWKLRPMAVSAVSLKFEVSMRLPLSMPRRMSSGSSRVPSSIPRKSVSPP